MAPGDDKIDKLNTTNETQENSPDVSVDNKNENNKKQKEQEEDMTTKNTQTNLVELQKKIEIIKTSKQYTQEIKDQATQIESDLTGAQIDQTTITTKAKEIAELEKQKTPQTFPEKVWNWFKKTSFGTAVTSLLKKWGLGDIFGDTESPIIAPKKNAPSAAPRATQNTAVETTETSENSDEESPQVDGEAIDDAIIPNAEPEVKEEKKPEMSKVDIEREVKVSMDNFWEVVKSIDSGFSMFTKNDKDIKDDGIKLDAAYQKVLDQLKNISEFFPNDESMKELMRKTMSELSSFYRDKAETDNDHHVDPIKAVQLLIPTVSEIEDVMGQKADLLPMPTQEKLIEELKKTSEGMKIADKIAVLVVKWLSMEQILEDKEIQKVWNDNYKKLFDAWEKKFDHKLEFIYGRYKAGKCPGLTPYQIKSLEALKDLQGVSDRWDRKDRNASMAKNVAGGVGAIAAGIAVTVFTAGAGSAGGVAGVSLGSTLLAAAVWGTVTTVGLWANENKWMGGTELAGNFVLNAAPFGVGKVFSMLRGSAVSATIIARSLKVWSYVAEWAVDVALMSWVQTMHGDSFVKSVEDNIAWAIFPLLLHKGAPALKGVKSALVEKLFARKDLANETLTELNRAKILAQLGKKQLSQEILDKLNAKLSTLKWNETLAVLEEQTALTKKKQTLLDDITAYIQENRVGVKAKLPIKWVSSGFIDNFNQIGDKLIVVNSQWVRKEVTLIKFAGKDSIVSIDGAAPVRANLTGGKLNVKDPAFRGDKITGSYLAKHKNPRGVDVNAMMVDLQTAKRDLVNVKALSATFEAFGPQMNDIAKIYPQMQRDLRNLRKGGKEIEDFMGYRVKKTDGGFEVTDVATGNATTMKNSGEVLNYVLPQAEKSGTKILTYKLQHLYDNMDAAKLEKILQRGKGVKKINGKMPAYEVSVDGVAYQVEFNSAIWAAEKVIFKDLQGNIITDASPLMRSLESKVFVDITNKYRVFTRQCKDIKTPLGKLIPDAMKPKILQALADKLHKPLVVIENMTIWPVLEACEKFADLPTFRNFTRIVTGGNTWNSLLLTGILMADATQNNRTDIGPDYIKYVLGWTLAPLVGIANGEISKKIDNYKWSQTPGEKFTKN